MCKWNLSPLFWTWNLAKLKYWYYEMHLTMKNHIIIHSNVFFIIKLGVVCCRNITGSGKKNWLWGIFHIIAKCPNFYELIYDSSGQNFSKSGISCRVNHLITTILFFCKSFLIIFQNRQGLALINVQKFWISFLENKSSFNIKKFLREIDDKH